MLFLIKYNFYFIIIHYSHSYVDITNTVSAFENVCKIINKNITNDNYEKHLEGKLPKSIWTLKILPTKKC